MQNTHNKDITSVIALYLIQNYTNSILLAECHSRHHNSHGVAGVRIMSPTCLFGIPMERLCSAIYRGSASPMWWVGSVSSFDLRPPGRYTGKDTIHTYTMTKDTKYTYQGKLGLLDIHDMQHNCIQTRCSINIQLQIDTLTHIKKSFASILAYQPACDLS
jgi:hypothetical protein